MLAFINIYFCLLFGLFYLIAIACIKVKDKYKYRADIIVFAACFGIYAAGNYLRIITAYKANKAVYYADIARIEEFKKSNPDCSKKCTLYLLPPPEPTYAAAWLIGADWVEISVKDYFELPSNTVLKYENE